MGQGKPKDAAAGTGRHRGSSAHPGVGETTAAGEGWEALQNHLCATQSFYLLAFYNLQEASKQTQQREKRLIGCLGCCPQ